MAASVPVPIVLDPLLPDDESARMVDIWHRFPRYGLYSNEGFDTAFAPELAQRYDAAVNFVRTGGRFARTGEEPSMLAARTNYFRETYAYGEEITAPGIESFFHAEPLMEAARQLHGRDVVVPAIVYANILLPGQELAVHTDVGEFRGANRKIVPQWLIVVMHHSGLFDAWRMPIATGISYFGGGRGGELAYYPEGADGPPATYAPKHNTAVVLDTDSIFHGVDRVLGDDEPLRDLRPGMHLQHDGDERWTVRDGEQVVGEYATDDIRYSVSWKAYCFADEAEREAWAGHHDDLTLDSILERLVADLCDRGRLDSLDHGLADAELGKLLIDEYVRFPAPQPASA
jgi:hypothetical protein